MTLTNPLRYEHSGDVQMRLKNSIVRYKNRPFYVDYIEGLEVIGQDLESQQELRVHSSDTKLDISSPPLGWARGRKSTIWYITRQPTRSQKQGLNIQKAIYFAPKGVIGPQPEEIRGYPGKYFEGYVPYVELINNTFPSFKNQLNCKAGVFDRGWAFVRKTDNVYVIYNKIIPVALYLRDKKEFLFKENALTKTRKTQLEDLLTGEITLNEVQI